MEASPPVKPLSDRQFATVVNSPQKEAQILPGEARNRERAAESLSHIFTLRSSSSFDWYLREGLLAQIKEADKARNVGGADLAVKLERWKALAELHDWFVGLEITYRTKFDSNDPEIPKLRQTLLLS